MQPSIRGKQLGFTLTELLVVISIIVILAGVLVPMLQPLLVGQDVRETARIVNAYFAGAQAKSIRQGRPVGVWIERDPQNLNSAFRCFTAEVPLPYAGDTEQSRALVVRYADPQNRLAIPEPFQSSDKSLQNPAQQEFRWYNAIIGLSEASALMQLLPHIANPPGKPPGPSEITNAPNLPYYGDEIRLHQRGPRYPLFSIDMSDPTHMRLWFLARPNEAPPLSNPSATPPLQLPLAFEVFRRPEKTSNNSLNLPEGTVLDLSIAGSGWGKQNTFPLNDKPIIVMFSPKVGIDRVYSAGTVLESKESLMLLVGRSQQVPAVPRPQEVVSNGNRPNLLNAEEVFNLEDPSNLWVTINARTGRINTATVVDPIPDTNIRLTIAGLPTLDSTTLPPLIELSRTLALAEISTGGR